MKTKLLHPPKPVAVIVITGALLAMPSLAMASPVSLTLPDGNSYVDLNTIDQSNNNTNQNQSQTGSAPISNALTTNFSSLAGTANYQSSPNLTATVYSLAPSGAEANIYEYMLYNFEVQTQVGAPNVQVPLIITASGGVTTAHNQAGQNYASIFFGTPSGDQVLAQACSEPAGGNTCTGLSSSFSIAAPVTVTSDSLYNIQMSLQIQTNTYPYVGQSDSGSGFVDPIITIDPTFALASDFQLVFSPGVGNSPNATPLPAALPLFATGLGAMGFVGRRRKRKSVAAIAA
jgi:hypothetical protein